MSYTRFPLYAWTDGANVHIWIRAGFDDDGFGAEPPQDGCAGVACGIRLPDARFDQLAGERFAERAVLGELAGVLAATPDPGSA